MKAVVFSALAGLLVAAVAVPAAARPGSPQAAPGPAAGPDAFGDHLRRCHAEHICNGVYLVARDGVPLHVGAVGDAGDPARTPLAVDTAFDIGSISKQFTAAAVLKLVEEGRLSLDDKVAARLPGFPYPDVTVAQLLSHTSGVPDVLPSYSRILRSGAAGQVTGEDVAQVLAADGAPLEFEPGSRFEYSNTGYMVLAVLVEAVSGRPLGAYLDETFFGPLGMKATLLRTPQAEPAIDHRAFGFRPRPVGERRPLDQIPGFYIKGAGGLYSTVGDLLIWQNAMNAGRVVSPELLRRATEPTRLTDGTSVPYGFALNLKPDPLGARRISHSGDWRAFKSDLSYYPDTDVTVIQLTNNGEDDSVDANVPALAAIAAGGSPTLPRPSIQWDLYEEVAKSDRESTRTWFETARAASPKRYEINEGELNALGYQLMENEDPARAAVVFEMATLAFPQSDNAFDSLADAQEAQGDLQAALASVRTALTLKPDSTAYRDRIESLSARLR